MSQKLQKKRKGICKLLQYYTSLINTHKKDSLLVFSNKQNIDNEIRKKQIINAIFYENDHHQIIKKGCDFVYSLFKGNAIGNKELEVVWKSCRHRLEAVRKVMYLFFETICKQLKYEDLQYFVKLLIEQQMVEEMDKNFYCAFFKSVLGWAQKDKIPIIQQLFQFSYKRILTYPEEIKQFAELITMQKSQNYGLLSRYAKLIINEIEEDEQNIIYIKLLNNIYEQSTSKYLKIESNAFNKIFNKLCKKLKLKIKKQNNEREYEIKKQKIKEFLYLLQNMSINQFKFGNQEFLVLWQLFNDNPEIKQSVFLRWILNVSADGILKQEVTTINRCIKEKVKLKEYIFNNILKNHNILDYVNISEMELKIFEKFMIEVNADEGNLCEFVHKLSMITYFRMNERGVNLIGLAELWIIFQNCRGVEVNKRVVRMILNFYLNYKNEVSNEIKCRKIQQLLNKINDNMEKGGKKSNGKLVKNSLFMLYQLIIQIKQIQKQNELININIKQFTKHIKIQKNQNQLYQLQIKSTQSVKFMKKRIAQHFNIHSYQIILFKRVFEYFIDHQEHGYSSNSDASASSVHTQYNLKHKQKINKIKSISLEQIPKELYLAPTFILMIQQNQGKIIIKEKQNIILQKLTEYISSKLEKKLLEILEKQQKQQAELTYLILTEITFNMNPLKILDNLMQQLSEKQKKIGENRMDCINLHGQSINFRMYFYKNLNLLKDEQFDKFITNKIKQFDIIISIQISKKIKQNIQIQLLLQIINIIKKCLIKYKINKLKCSSHDILQCFNNFLSYINIQKNNKQNQFIQNINYIKLFYQCFFTLQVMFQKKYSQIINCIVQYDNFQKIMNYLFENMPKSKYSNAFANKFQQYFKKQHLQLSQQTQQILYRVIFDKIYSKVIISKGKKYLSFFKIIKCIIWSASQKIIYKLLQRKIIIQNAQLSFWDICLNVIKKQTDFYHQEDKQNTLFSSHLSILQALIRNNPEKVDQSLWKMVFYNCLFYSEQYTEGNDVKCFSLGSIKAGLLLLFAICEISQKCLMKTTKQLRRLQMGKDWRTPEEWVANVSIDEKSSCGFVGLQNPGCICYLNSFVQTLFMNMQFRNRVINFRQMIEGQDYSLLIQMRRLFLNLQYSEQKCIDPVPFSKTIKNSEGKPLIKIFEQMDIEQYSSILFDKIEKLLPKGQDFVKQIFEGTYSNDIISKQCKHSSQRQQNFLSMQLDVKSTLQDSLKILVNGQVLEGQNAYFCQKCDKKVKAIKRMSIKKLPNYLIICLKRFQYNFEIDQKIKVNAFCEFPKEITFQQYSQQFLNSLQVQQPLSFERGEQIQSQNPILPHQYFQYKLKGVIIHTGSADSGHYYTLIEVDSQSGKWVQFNDSSVTQFDIRKLPEEAFGSDDPMSFKLKNAYMLVYERKKKIHSKIAVKPQQNMEQQQQMQEISTKSNEGHQKTHQFTMSFSPQNFSQQAEKLHKQIVLHNKQMRIFHMMLTHQYRQFIQQMVKHVFKKNRQYNQQKQLISNHIRQIHHHKKNNLNADEDSQNGYSDQTIQQVIKFYLEHCIFVRSRQAKLINFIQSLKEMESCLSSRVGLPVIDYFIHQLSQQLLIYQLFISISAKEKRIVISHFIWEMISIRMDRVSQKQRNRFFILVFKFVKTLMSVIIDNGVCINEGFYIIRKMIEKSREFSQFLLKIDIFSYAFEIVAGINQSDEERRSKIERIHYEVYNYIQQKYYVKFKDGSLERKQTEMEEQNSERYEMETVKKTGKYLLKNQSLQQVWNYLYYILKFEQQQLQRYEQGNKDEQINKNDSQNQIKKIRKQTFQDQFMQLSQDRISHFILNCQGAQAANSLSIFLCKAANGNKKNIQKLCSVIDKALKQYEAIKMRYYLILAYHIIMSGEPLYQFKIIKAIQTLQNSLVQNAKYVSQMDILYQWIIKLIVASKKFKQMVIKSDEGKKLRMEIYGKLDYSKKSLIQLINKLKNPFDERYKFLLHGLKISLDLQEYENIFREKKQFFELLFKQEYLPSQYGSIKKIETYLQPNYQELTREIKIGSVMNYFKKLMMVFVQSCQYGMVKIHRIVKDNEKGGRNSMVEENAEEARFSQQDNNRNNIIKMNGMVFDIGEGYKLDEEYEIVWQTDERLRTINKFKKLKNPEMGKSYKPNQIMEDQPESACSNLSYNSENR